MRRALRRAAEVALVATAAASGCGSSGGGETPPGLTGKIVFGASRA